MFRRGIGQSRQRSDGTSQKVELTWQRHIADGIYTDSLHKINITTIKSLHRLGGIKSDLASLKHSD